MNKEEKELLEKTYALSKENNNILRSLQRKSRIGVTIKILKWGIIILITVWSFSIIQPIIDDIKGTTDTVKGLQDSSGIGSLLNIFGGSK